MKHFGLIGHPLGHSFSKDYFTKKFDLEGLDCEYRNYDLEDISMVRQLMLSGFNVTIPFKEAILPYLDELDPVAAEVGAVNTVKVLPNERLKGFNTDVIGFDSLLSEGNNLPALILGTGGASKAVQYVLHQRNIPYHLVSRDPSKGDFTYHDLTSDIIKSHMTIINATPVGMFPNVDEAPALPYEALTNQHTLIDLIYNPEETLFLRHGSEHGATTINGLSMLHAQADASWEIWGLVIASEAEQSNLPTACFESSWIASSLHSSQ